MSKRQRTASGSSSAASASAASGTGDEAPAAKILRLEGEVRALREREGALVMKLSMQEGEVHTLKSCIQDLYKTKSRAEGSLRKTLLDPTINMEVKLLKDQLREANDKLDTNQAELEAVKFDPKSNTGRKLVNKCKTLVRENEELGKQVSEGNIQQLRVERDLQKSEVVRLRKDLEEALMYNEDMDEERCVRGAVPLGACTGVRAGGGSQGGGEGGGQGRGARGVCVFRGGGCVVNMLCSVWRKVVCGMGRGLPRPRLKRERHGPWVPSFTPLLVTPVCAPRRIAPSLPHVLFAHTHTSPHTHTSHTHHTHHPHPYHSPPSFSSHITNTCTL